MHLLLQILLVKIFKLIVSSIVVSKIFNLRSFSVVNILPSLSRVSMSEILGFHCDTLID